MNTTQQLGKKGEDAVARALSQRGYTIVVRNYHARGGEIDIIARKDRRTHVMEVKTRSCTSHGAAIESLTRKKLRRMQHALTAARQEGLICGAVQFDFAAVQITGGAVSIQLFQNISPRDLH